MTRPSRLASAIVIAVGAVLAGIHGVHGLEELGDALPPVLYGVVLPGLASLFIIGSGIWMVRRSWDVVTPWRLVGWVLGGGVGGGVLIGLLVLYQDAEGVTLSDQQFVLPMFATYGCAVGLLLGYYDVNRQLHQIRQQRRTRRLDNFASHVSHDLRNPLSVAEGHLELAREECDSDHLEEIAQSHRRMQSLIDDLLALARTEDASSEPESVDVASLVSQCWETLPTANAELHVESDLTVSADRGHLQQLFENVLRNAIEHGGETVTVRIGVLSGGDGFYIEDDGPGIPPAEREEVLESGYSHASDGTGFGLAIVNSVVQAHDWTITVTDSDAGGARFEIANVDRPE